MLLLRVVLLYRLSAFVGPSCNAMVVNFGVYEMRSRAAVSKAGNKIVVRFNY